MQQFIFFPALDYIMFYWKQELYFKSFMKSFSSDFVLIDANLFILHFFTYVDGIIYIFLVNSFEKFGIFKPYNNFFF